ncbi:hypothetical protein EVAR_45747_1 [Eumeta japonica]|uniref:Uncharacterized protein n=1 Tax=Eumeta variegata TaxID=151549 RepID=A0A4C1YRX0_EUMVA|nr:hypothetical protein EVAR_45747_1 [Eumeta japonica]
MYRVLIKRLNDVSEARAINKDHTNLEPLATHLENRLDQQPPTSVYGSETRGVAEETLGLNQCSGDGTWNMYRIYGEVKVEDRNNDIKE